MCTNRPTDQKPYDPVKHCLEKTGTEGCPTPELPARWDDKSGMLNIRCADDAITAWNCSVLPSRGLTPGQRQERRVAEAVNDWCKQNGLDTEIAGYRLRHAIYVALCGASIPLPEELQKKGDVIRF